MQLNSSKALHNKQSTMEYGIKYQKQYPVHQLVQMKTIHNNKIENLLPAKASKRRFEDSRHCALLNPKRKITADW